MDGVVEVLMGLARVQRPKSRLGMLTKHLRRNKIQKEVAESKPQVEASLDRIMKSIVLERVFRDLRKALISQPKVEYFYLLADICRINLDLSSEIQYIRYAIHAYPEDRPMRQRLSSILTSHGIDLMSIAARNKEDPIIYGSAISQFTEAAELDKENARVFAYKAICLVKIGEISKALDAIDRAIAFTTDTQTAHHKVDMLVLRAKLYQCEGMVEKSIIDMRVATSIDANHPEVIAFNSRTIMMTERRDNSIVTIQWRIRFSRYYMSGMEAFEAKDYDKVLSSHVRFGVSLVQAIGYIKEALLVSPEDMRLLIMLARLHRITEKIDMAYDYIQRAKVVFRTLSENTLPLPYDLEHQRNLGDTLLTIEDCLPLKFSL